MAGAMGRWRIGAAALLAAAALAGCAEDRQPVTECLGTSPAVERIRDVGPPNCDAALPAGVS
jgi:hypothetical protein